MLFQSLDDKKHCVGIYTNGKLVFDDAAENLTQTWEYTHRIGASRNDIDYASLYCCRSLANVCPSGLLGEWNRVESKLRSFLRSFIEAKVDLDEHCFYELVPPKFLLEYCEIKNQISEWVFDNYEKPSNYDFLVSLSKVVGEVEGQKLNIEPGAIKSLIHQPRERDFWKSIIGKEHYIKYNVFGTKTGRLTTKKSSFPILTLNKNWRGVIKPHNDWLVELDFNAAELRTLMALNGLSQPPEDIHEWNIKHLFDGVGTREEAKKRIFAWLYNPDYKDEALESHYKRSAVVEKYFDGQEVKNPFHRVMPCDKEHALNYTIQSTTSDVVLRQMIQVFDFLKEKESNLLFSLHDSIILDMTDEDCKKHLRDIVKMFGNTQLGNFLVNVRVGKNYGEMTDAKIR